MFLGFALTIPRIHPHPSPLPSRERGQRPQPLDSGSGAGMTGGKGHASADAKGPLAAFAILQMRTYGSLRDLCVIALSEPGSPSP